MMLYPVMVSLILRDELNYWKDVIIYINIYHKVTNTLTMNILKGRKSKKENITLERFSFLLIYYIYIFIFCISYQCQCQDNDKITSNMKGQI